MIPQIIIVSFTLIRIGVQISKHGEPKLSQYNAITSIINAAIFLSLLYWGGFFDCFSK